MAASSAAAALKTTTGARTSTARAATARRRRATTRPARQPLPAVSLTARPAQDNPTEEGLALSKEPTPPDRSRRPSRRHLNKPRSGAAKASHRGAAAPVAERGGMAERGVMAENAVVEATAAASGVIVPAAAAVRSTERRPTS